MRLQAALFDMDGVLVDSEAAHAAAYEGMFAERGVAFGREAYREVGLGRSREEVIRAVLGDVSDADLAVLMARKVELVRAHLSGVRPMAGARDAVVRARGAGLAVAVVTSSRTPALFLGAAGLDDLFSTVVHRGDVQRGKPAPDLYLEAIRRLGVPAAACLAVEDSAAGVASAKAAGCRVVGLTASPADDGLAHADERVTTLDAIAFGGGVAP